ncbi:MAG TPA: energy transducer TonB [Fibrobacteraceae bacterium]|nr:energy transducer TonB [Fibrobacteraceae bacterium]
MLRPLRKILVVVSALTCSFLLLVSIPLVNLWIKGEGLEKKYTKTEVGVLRQLPPQKQAEPKKTRQVKRQAPTQRSLKSGPRFAMDLGAIGGSGGAAVSTDILKAGGTQSEGAISGDVDEKPTLRGSSSFQPPPAIRQAERDALLRLEFCVDVNGRPYDIRVAEETPAGMGLAEAGRDALSRASFTPAQKDGHPVAFCGLEQPFEVRFRE